MTKITEKKLATALQIKGIELLNSSIQLPANPQKSFTTFNFNIGIESRVEEMNRLIFVIVHVGIKGEEESMELGSLSVSCIYQIANFEEVIKVQSDGKVDIPQNLIEALNSISISTTRGIMFSTFKGTFLHNAVLPIIDPKQFKIGN